MAASRMVTKARTRSRFRRAQREAVRTGAVVCATVKDGKTVFFPMPPGASEADMARASFKMREGREMNFFEEQIMAYALNRLHRGEED